MGRHQKGGGATRPSGRRGQEVHVDAGEPGLAQELHPHMLLKHPATHRGLRPLGGPRRDVGSHDVRLRGQAA